MESCNKKICKYFNFVKNYFFNKTEAEVNESKKDKAFRVMYVIDNERCLYMTILAFYIIFNKYYMLDGFKLNTIQNNGISYTLYYFDDEENKKSGKFIFLKKDIPKYEIYNKLDERIKLFIEEKCDNKNKIKNDVLFVLMNIIRKLYKEKSIPLYQEYDVGFINFKC